MDDKMTSQVSYNHCHFQNDMHSIVLRRRDFREDDQIVSFYTRELGKIELLARGVKKIDSKNSPHLEPCSWVDISYARGKEIDRLTKVQPVKIFKNLRADLNKSLSAEYASALLEKITEPKAKDERIFCLFLEWLQFLEDARLPEGVPLLLLAIFTLKLFGYLGFQPVLNRCVVGGEEIKSAQESYGFYFAGGGVVCARHKEEKQRAGELVLGISLEQIATLRLLLTDPRLTIAQTSLEAEEVQHLWNVAYQFAQFHSEKRLPAWLYGWS